MNIGSLIRRAVGSYNASKTGRYRGRPVRSRHSAQSSAAGGIFRMLRRKL